MDLLSLGVKVGWSDSGFSSNRLRVAPNVGDSDCGASEIYAIHAMRLLAGGNFRVAAYLQFHLNR